MSRFLLVLALLALGCGDDAPTEEDSPPAREDAGHKDARVADAAAPVEEASKTDARVAVDARVQDAAKEQGDAGNDDSKNDAQVKVDAAVDASQPANASGSDDIYGTSVPRADSWWVGDGKVHRGDKVVRLYGLNWFGLETDSHALFGPSQANRSLADFLSQIKSLGFTALRVPLAPESIRPGTPSASWANHGAVDTGREQFEEFAAAASKAGLYMLWDIHTCASSVGYMKKSPIDPACANYGKQGWLDDLKTLAELAKDYEPWVLGIDLFNEPYGLTWADWKALAQEGGEVVLRANPNILTFVEGVGSEGYSGDAVFWGENLTQARAQKPSLPASRLVFSPHVYGPSVYQQPYFTDSAFPTNMPAIWDKHWGYLFADDTPVIVGEFGGKYVDADQVWQDAVAKYLQGHDFFYWCLNPNSGDTGGLLKDDWKTVDDKKLGMLKTLMK